MANKVLQRVWDHSQQRGAARCLVLAIADVADVDGIAYPGVAYLAKMICEDEDYTFRLIRKVIAAGELLHKPGGGRGRKTLYAVACGLSAAQIEHLNTVLECRVLREKNPAQKSSEKRNPGLQNTVIERDKPWTLPDSNQTTFEPMERAERPISKKLIHDHDPIMIDDDRDRRTLDFLENEGVGAAKEFTHLPYEPMVLDFQNRIAAGQSIPTIVKAWRRTPPTETYHYERTGHQGAGRSDPGRNGTGSTHGRVDRGAAARPPRPGDPAYYARRRAAGADRATDPE